MKNTKREVVERLVALNYAELSFLESLVRGCDAAIPNSGPADAARRMVWRVKEKLERAQRARYHR